MSFVMETAIINHLWRKVDAADGALMSILIGVGVTLVFFLGLCAEKRGGTEEDPG